MNVTGHDDAKNSQEKHEKARAKRGPWNNKKSLPIPLLKALSFTEIKC
jgi:hypothetical protein